MRDKARAVLADSLFRNSFYLMIATAVVAAFGFLFWLLAAHLFATAEVGLATTLISMMSLIALLSLIGFDTVFIRYLPNSTNKNEKVNTGMLMVGLFACLLATVFIILVPEIAPKLIFVRENPLTICAFIFFSCVAALNVLTDAYFLAFRQAKYTLIINIIFSMLKVLAVFLFAGRGAMAIFVAAGIAQLAGTILSIAVMVWKFDYKPRLLISRPILREVRRYSSATYVSGMLNLLPPTILPIIITDKLGPDSAAYFYIVLMIANLLYTISFATARSLFAEGSYDEYKLAENTKKAFRFVLAIMVPCIAITILLGPFVLSFFGSDYATQGTALLRLMALSGLAVAAYSIYGSIFRVRRNLRAMLIINSIFAVSTISIGFILLPLGLVGIGIGWLVGQSIAVVLAIYFDRAETAKLVASVAAS